MPHWEMYEAIVQHGARYSSLHDYCAEIESAARADERAKVLAEIERARAAVPV